MQQPDAEDDFETVLLSAYRAFVAMHGYAPGLRMENGVIYLLPLENDGIVEAEPEDAA